MTTPADPNFSKAGIAPSDPAFSLSAQHSKTAALNAKFERLAFELGDGEDGEFLSGWQCQNPFAAPLLNAVRQYADQLDHTRYSYFDAHLELLEAISDHHSEIDGKRPTGVLCGCGTTALLFTWAAHLQSRGVEEVYYIPPLYITLQSALDRFGIRQIPISDKQPYEPDFAIWLPEKPGAILHLTDPVWFAGTSVPAFWIEAIAEWQHRNGATVFVDGSLQYMPWKGDRREATAKLSPDLTVRLVCPSKQLCTHGFRFSYMLTPAASLRELAWTYTNVFGPAPAASIAFAHAAIEAVSSGDIPRALMKLSSERYEMLIEGDVIESSIVPHCGYFIFARVMSGLPDGYLQIDGSYFEQLGYPGYAKINLLSPAMRLLTAG